MAYPAGSAGISTGWQNHTKNLPRPGACSMLQDAGPAALQWRRPAWSIGSCQEITQKPPHLISWDCHRIPHHLYQPVTFPGNSSQVRNPELSSLRGARITFQFVTIMLCRCNLLSTAGIATETDNLLIRKLTKGRFDNSQPVTFTQSKDLHKSIYPQKFTAN